MHPEAIPAAVIFVGAFALGVRSTKRLYRTYRDIAPTLAPNRRQLGQSFVIVAAVITILAGAVGGLTVRQMLGFERLEYAGLILFPLSIAVLLLPAYLDRVWRRIGRA